MSRLLPRGSVLALLATGSILLPSPPARAQEKAPSGLRAALAVTRSTGAATVAVFTSRADPKSQRFHDEFDRGPWARYNRGLVQVVAVAIEDEPAVARTMGIVKVPVVKIYGKTPKGVSLLAAIDDCPSPDALAARLVGLQVGLQPPGKDDPAVSQASGHGGAQASAQSYASPQAWPQVQTPATPQIPATPQAPAPPQIPATPQAPMLAFPTAAPTVTTTTANVVQVPSQNLLIQQAAPQIFMAPAPSPTVYVPQQPTATPMMAMAAAPTAAAAPVAGNMLLPVPSAAPAAPVAAPTMMAAPVAAPTMMAAAVAAPTMMAAPVAAAPTMMAAAVAAPTVMAAPVAAAPATTAVAAPAATVATLSNQSLSLPSSGTRTRVRVRGPGLLASGMARLGERMVQLGRTRIETIQETTLEAPAPQAPGIGTTTISTTSASPVVPPPSSVAVPIQQMLPPRQPAAPQAPAIPAVPPGPTPTPQAPSQPTPSPQSGPSGHFHH